MGSHAEATPLRPWTHTRTLTRAGAKTRSGAAFDGDAPWRKLLEPWAGVPQGSVLGPLFACKSLETNCAIHHVCVFDMFVWYNVFGTVVILFDDLQSLVGYIRGFATNAALF